VHIVSTVSPSNGGDDVTDAATELNAARAVPSEELDGLTFLCNQKQVSNVVSVLFSSNSV